MKIDVRLIKTDVTCIKIYNGFLFCGIGPFLHIFNLKCKTLIHKVEVFNARRIFGIDINAENTMLIFGENELKVYTVNWKTMEFFFFKSLLSEDWISMSKWIDNNKNLVVVSMHNETAYYTTELIKIKESTCKEQCMLYCSHISYNTWEEVVIFSGTVFSEILIWKPSDSSTDGFSPVIKKLNGHKGVLFSLDFNIVNKHLCSTSDDRSIVFWKTISDITNLKKLCTLFGHTGRVFRCKVLDNLIISCGEDGLINLWNLTGDKMRTIEAHQSGAIWSIDAEKNFIISGGSDAAVTMFPITPVKTKKVICLSRLETPKLLAILFNNDIALVTLNGSIYHYKSEDRCLLLINTHDELKSYAVLEVYKRRKHFAVVGFYGHIFVYQLKGKNLMLVLSYQTPVKSRILAFHWLAWNYFITCGEQGILNLWTLKNKTAILLHKMKMNPSSKEPWSTCACFISKKVLIGDRKGNLHLYSLQKQNAVYTFWKAHNYLGVTQIKASGNEIISLGRNSTLRRFKLCENELLPLVSDKVPVVWLGNLLNVGNLQVLIGFLGRDFIMWDYKHRRIIHKINCGGGHRSWDFNYNNNDMETCFTFIKDKSIHQHIYDWNSICSYNITQPYNARDINTITCCKNLNGSTLLISGGEDTTISISTIDDDENENQFVRQKLLLKSHISSIRCSDIVSCLEDDNNNYYLLVTAGGRGQIIIWKVINDDDDQSNVCCRETFSYVPPVLDTEVRIMDICLQLFDSKCMIFAGCSSGHIKVYEVINNKIQYSWSIDYKRKCILKVAALICDNKILLLTTSTDGHICFWLINVKNKTFDFSYSLRIHQSGINSLSVQKFENNFFGVLTGGDDGLIKLNFFKFHHEVNSTTVNVVLVDSFENSFLHCAQITGVYLSKSYFITSSVDQKIAIFKYSFRNNNNCVDVESTIRRFNTTVADLKGIKVVVGSLKNELELILYGYGIEILKVCL